MFERLVQTYEALPARVRWSIEVKYYRVESKIVFILSRLGLVRLRWDHGYDHEALDDFINSIFSRLGLAYRYRNVALQKFNLESWLSSIHESLSYQRKGMLMTGALPDALRDVETDLRQVAIWQKQCDSTIDIVMVNNSLFHRGLLSSYHANSIINYCDLSTIWLLTDKRRSA